MQKDASMPRRGDKTGTLHLMQVRVPGNLTKKIADRQTELGVATDAAYLRLLVLRDIGIADPSK
jgi:hypothetical protein